MRLGGVFTLGVQVNVADLNGLEFILADAAGEDFGLAGFGVEEPLAAGGFGDGDGERPVVVADVEDGASAIQFFQMGAFGGAVGEFLEGVGVFDLSPERSSFQAGPRSWWTWS